MPEKKKKLSDNVKCGHCQNVAPMEIVGEHSDPEELYYADGQQMGDQMGTDAELLICPSCRKPTVRTCEWGPWLEPGYELPWKILYPEPRGVPLGLPKKVATAYEAASRVRGVDANAFGVLLGRVLDRVCEDKKAKGRTLNDRLNNLAEREIMPRSLAGMAHGLRDLRNIGGHADLGELTEEEIPILDSLCRAVLEYVYSGPELIARVKRRLDELKDRSN